jgi:enamine deaminase RidA (YjgF/YER057c/UK114 family)
MSHLQYFSYAKNFHYSQSVRLPHNQILVSGQPGLNRETGKISAHLREEIDQAFRNVDTAVREAGGKSKSFMLCMSSMKEKTDW